MRLQDVYHAILQKTKKKCCILARHTKQKCHLVIVVS